MHKMKREVSPEEFQSYVRIQVKKDRFCVTCRKVMKSTSAGHRMCSVCKERNEKLSHRCEQVWL